MDGSVPAGLPLRRWVGSGLGFHIVIVSSGSEMTDSEARSVPRPPSGPAAGWRPRRDRLGRQVAAVHPDVTTALLALSVARKNVPFGRIRSSSMVFAPLCALWHNARPVRD